MSEIALRMQLALKVVDQAAAVAANHFKAIDELSIEKKGHQDLVSNADREVEQLVRSLLLDEFPTDGVIGEEFENKKADSHFTWVIDPIDGTASFVHGRPGWCVVVACLEKQETVVAVVADPVAGEVFRAMKGQGAFLNDKRIVPSVSQTLGEGAVGVGYCNRFPPELVVQLMQRLLVEQGGLFYQNASGALMLSYVASGRLIGYVEPHMQPWDCMAALLIIEEAGGLVQERDQKVMIDSGDRVVAACPGVFDELAGLADDTYGEFSAS